MQYNLLNLPRKKKKKILGVVGHTSFIFFVFFSYAVSKGYFFEIDRYVNGLFSIDYSSFTYLYSKVLEYLYIYLGVLSARMFYKFYKKGEKLEALILGIVGFLSMFSQFFLKPLFDVLCPGSYYNSALQTYKLISNSEFVQKILLAETCYPSNHTIAYIVICGYLVLLLKAYYPKRLETNTLVAILVFIIATIGFSRIYLHVHWLSDVVAAYFLGGTYLSLIFWTRLHRREFRAFLKAIYEKLEKN